jgi:hypothetical protein
MPRCMNLRIIDPVARIHMCVHLWTWGDWGSVVKLEVLVPTGCSARECKIYVYFYHEGGTWIKDERGSRLFCPRRGKHPAVNGTINLLQGKHAAKHPLTLSHIHTYVLSYPLIFSIFPCRLCSSSPTFLETFFLSFFLLLLFSALL